jgi:hypothetical protein
MFNNAEGEFRIQNALVDFSQIRLEGPSVSLIGQGTVGFLSHAIDLQFLYRPRSKTPVIGPIVEALGRGWATITVRGTVENPVTTQQAQLPIVTPAIKLLMQSMERGQMPRPMARPIGR